MLHFSIIQSLPVLIRAVVVTLCVLFVQAAQAQQDADGLLGGAALFGNTPSPASDIEISAVLNNVDDGRTEVQVTVLVPEGYYIYSMNPSFSGGTKIVLLDTGSLTANKPQWQADHEPKSVFEKDLDQTVEKFFGSVTWTTTLEGTAEAGTIVTGKLSGLYCSSPEFGGNGECIPVRNRKFTAELAESETSPQNATAASTATEVATEIIDDKNPITVIPKIGYGKAAKEGLIRFEIGLTPMRPQIGDEVTLSIRTLLEEPWHTFALDQDPDMAGQPTTIELGTIKGLEPIGNEFKASVEPEIERPLDDIVQRVHSHEVTWSHRFVLTEPTAELDGLIRFQVCSKVCLSGNAEFALTLTAGQPDAAVGGSRSSPDPAGNAGLSKTANSNDRNDSQQEGFFVFVFTAAAAGFLALLTPCVFPMIPVTVAFFLKQEEKRAGSSIKLAIVYSLSIIGAFTILGLAMTAAYGPASLNTLANNRWLNLVFALLFVVFALMLIGVIEFQIPSSLLTWTSKRESTGGLVGVVFMALTFTLVSFTCTFAFVGSLLAWAAKGQVFWPVVGMLAFSSAFASPFFVLAMFPSMLKRLPKSGGWMNDVKVSLGLVELALVAKFLSVADIGFSANGAPSLISYRTFMNSWILLCALVGLYLLGIFRKQGPVSSNIKVAKFSCGLLFLLFGAYLSAGSAGVKVPLSPVWDFVVAFAPRDVKPGVDVRQTDDLGYVMTHAALDFGLEFEKAVVAAEKGQLPMFVDFTGVNCINCRKMERTVLVDHNVEERLRECVRVQLYTDIVPGISDQTLANNLIAQNQELQDSLAGSYSLPFYAIVSADGTEVLESFSGLDGSGGKDFVAFLDRGLKKWQAMKQTTLAAQIYK